MLSGKVQIKKRSMVNEILGVIQCWQSLQKTNI